MRRLVSCVVLAGCAIGGSDLDTHNSSVILGSPDLISVARDGSNVPARYRGLYDAIGRMMPMKCTVSHVGNGIAITAGHCFGSARNRATNLPCMSETATDITIEWGVRGDLDAQGYMVSRCTKILAIEYHEKETDFAVIQVSPAPNAAVPISFDRPAQERELTIFGHPRGRPLEWSQLCKRRAQLHPSVFKHDCDTEPGSSGSGVIDDATLRVIGIHNGGIAGEYNYATFLADTALSDILAGGGDPPPQDPQDPQDPTPVDPNHEPVSNGGPTTISNATIAQGAWIDYGPYQLDSPSYLRVEMTGTGDADLYMRKGQPTDGAQYDCLGGTPSSNESCWVYGTGPVWISIYGYTAATFSLQVR